MPGNNLPFSTYLLLSANLVPLIGVLFFGWDSMLVLALFWIENLIIGAFNILRIASVSLVNRNFQGVMLIGFFLIHYGAFCSIHGMLLADLLGYPDINTAEVLGFESNGILDLFLNGAAVFATFLNEFSPIIWLGISGLVLSRFASYIENFILNGRIFEVRAGRLMTEPYSQIIIMHAGLLLGAILLAKFGSPVWLLATIVVLKIFIDFHQFRRRHLKSIHLTEQR